jgi:threonine dehydrogenase-like Zn-dependent dehydrogenase
LARVPDQVSDEDACFIELAVIAMQGVRRARLQPGERVVVLGVGLVGQLALQFARWAGAAPLVAVARTSQGFDAARAGGADECIQLSTRPGATADLEADVVLEATGSPSAILTACECARSGGRVVLLGSSRGMTSGFDFQSCVAARGLEVIGAHISSLATRESGLGRWTRRDEAELFLELVANGRLHMAPLISRRVAPDEANRVYDDLLGGRDRTLGVVFDWTQLGRSRSSMSIPSPTVGRAASSGSPLGIGLIGCGEISAHNAAGIQNSSHCRSSKSWTSTRKSHTASGGNSTYRTRHSSKPCSGTRRSMPS